MAMNTVMIEDSHRKMGHISPDVTIKMVEDSRKPIRKEWELPCALNLGKEVHLDAWGLVPVKTVNVREYYISFTDDYS